MKIKKILVNDLEQALGIDDANPLFHVIWENGAAKEVCVHVFDEGENCIWEASHVTDLPYVYYNGPKLKSKSVYKVQMSTAQGKMESVFETGFMGESWEASWIEPVQEDATEEKELSFFEMITYQDDGLGYTKLRPCQEVKKDFFCRDSVKRARVYATSHGVYELSLNGRTVSDRRLAPETSCYEENLYYQTYDVTHCLNTGMNEIGAILADGWWIGRLSMAGDSCNYGKRLAFLMQLEIEYADGTRDVIVSDDTMLGRPSHICYSDLFIGEKWDMTIANGNHYLWKHCEVVNFDMDNLCGQPLNPVTVTEVIKNPTIIITPDGDTVLDFGQVLAGVIHIEFEGHKGQILTLEHGEILDEHGNFKSNIKGRNKDQKDICICTEGIQVFEPKFTYHGLRYVRLTGIDVSQIVSVQAQVLGTPLRKIGYFHCSDERLNQLQHNIEWSTRSNMFSVPTDCPQREKLGWTGDIQVYSQTGCFNYDLKNFLECWLKNMRIDQKDNGEIPVVVPNVKYQERTQRAMSGDNCSSVWSDACVLVPYYLYQAYGDKKVLEDNFDMMVRWLSFVDEICKRKPDNYDQLLEAEKERSDYLWTKSYHFGDWLIPSLRALPGGVEIGAKQTAPVVGSAFRVYVLKRMIDICHILGKNELAAEYEVLMPLVKDAVLKTYVATDGTVYGSDLQGLYVIVLACEIVDGELKQKVLRKLVDLIKANDYCLDTGFSSVSYLLDMLYDNGYEDVAYKMLFQTKAPSWLFMVENGATSIWENWEAVTKDGIPTDSSYNHYSFGCVGDWIYRHIGGIEKLEPGYKRVRIAPDFKCGLTFAQCALETPQGEISCNWKQTKVGYTVAVKIPYGVAAVIQIGDVCQEIGEGEYMFCI